MIQNTTPTLIFRVNNFNLTGYDVYVYIKQFNVTIVKDPSTISVEYEEDVSIVTVTLTESDTMNFLQGDALTQIWATNGTKSVASEPLPITVGKILYTEVE